MLKRKSEYKINDLILNRWSARAMSGENISSQELMSLFEAARWAPSSYNNQPWRFIFALKNTKAWDNFFDTLTQGNRIWAKNSSVLIVIVSRINFEYNNKPSKTHSFDTGSAMENLLLQGYDMGLVVHPIEGFDYNKIRTIINLPDQYNVEAMIVLGKPGSIENLPKNLQEVEKPSDRKKLEEIVFKDKFEQPFNF